MAVGLAAQVPASGLFLVQFDGAVEAGWKTELHSLGVELLKYVPDDAFIAQFNSVPPEKIQGLSYIRWLGPYRADYKVHPRLAAAGALPQTNLVLATTVLISPQATPAEIAGVRSLFASVAHESRLRSGCHPHDQPAAWIQRGRRHGVRGGHRPRQRGYQRDAPGP